MEIERKSVGIFLINSNNEILLQLRDNKQGIDHPGYWGIIGGEIEKEETPEKAIKRELKEEMGDVNIGEINLIGKMDLEKSDLILKNTRLFLFKGHVKIHSNKIKLNEGQKIGFFDLKELTKLKLVPSSKKFIFEYKENIFD